MFKYRKRQLEKQTNSALPETGEHNTAKKLANIAFSYRGWVVGICAIITLFMGYQSTQLNANANFEGMLPQTHPYIENYFDNQSELQGLGNTLSIVVENKDGTIFDAEYLSALEKLHNAIFLLPGVDRPWMKSLWAPVTRWTEVTEEGFEGGPVMPRGYDGSPKTMELLRKNISSAALVGNMVGHDLKSSMITVPILPLNPETGEPIDYAQFSKALKASIAEAAVDPSINVRVTGFAMLVGELLDGLTYVAIFFAMTLAIVVVLLFWYIRCLLSASLVIVCSIAAVIWQLGMISSLGYNLDPYTVLVPFVVFAVGVSHGAQIMNGVVSDVGMGETKLTAAKMTLKRLFIPGIAALVSDAVGFAVLVVIDIPVIRDLAVTASIGIAALIVTNLFLLPIMFSYTGVSSKAAHRLAGNTQSQDSQVNEFRRIVQWAGRLTEPRVSFIVLAGASVLGVVGLIGSSYTQVGDLDEGAPELWPDSTYNRDAAYTNAHYSLTSDVFAVMVKTPPGGCSEYETLVEIDRLQQVLEQVPGVLHTDSLANRVRQQVAGTFEGNPKWNAIPRNERMSSTAIHEMTGWGSEMVNRSCSLVPVLAYLEDHQASTLASVLRAAEEFSITHSTPDRQFLLAAGSSGIDAIRNIVVESASLQTLIYVYIAVILVSFIALRSWRAVVVAVIPLMLTSLIAYALMAALGIGITVATLAVVALGVGTGIDYAMYLLSVQLHHQRLGKSLKLSYMLALETAGKVVALIGFTLAAGVLMWIWSPIKFQADMGVLLTFMFLWNMLGALILIPALSRVLMRTEHLTKGHSGGVQPGVNEELLTVDSVSYVPFDGRRDLAIERS